MMQQGQARGGHGHGSAAQASPLFAALDKDKDGKLSRVELEQAVAALKTLDADRRWVSVAIRMCTSRWSRTWTRWRIRSAGRGHRDGQYADGF